MTINPTVWQVISNTLVFGGICAAILTIRYNVKMTRKTQTATFLFESRKDGEYIESLHTLKVIHGSGKSMRSYVFPPEGVSIKEIDALQMRKIQYILNFYERVAVSIKSGIYDEKMIKQTSYTTVIDTYDKSEELIKAIREKLQTQLTYQEYEWLHNRWKAAPLKRCK